MSFTYVSYHYINRFLRSKKIINQQNQVDGKQNGEPTTVTATPKPLLGTTVCCPVKTTA